MAPCFQDKDLVEYALVCCTWKIMVQGRQILQHGWQVAKGQYTYMQSMSVIELSLNKERYVALLEKLIGETEFLQDSPPKFIPQENR